MSVSHCSKVAVIIIKEEKNHAIIKTTSCSRIWACGLHVDKEEQVCQRHSWANRAISKMEKKRHKK